MGRHRPEEIERRKEIARRGRKVILTVGKRPRLTPSDTDPKMEKPQSRIRKKD